MRRSREDSDLQCREGNTGTINRRVCTRERAGNVTQWWNAFCAHKLPTPEVRGGGGNEERTGEQ